MFTKYKSKVMQQTQTPSFLDLSVNKRKKERLTKAHWICTLFSAERESAALGKPAGDLREWWHQTTAPEWWKPESHTNWGGGEDGGRELVWWRVSWPNWGLGRTPRTPGECEYKKEALCIWLFTFAFLQVLNIGFTHAGFGIGVMGQEPNQKYVVVGLYAGGLANP